MGQRNPDRIPIAARRRRFETVGAMYAGRWLVNSRCLACGLQMRVDLRVIIALRGPDVSLWNRRARCRRIGCAGAVQFEARPPDMDGFRPLTWHADGLN